MAEFNHNGLLVNLHHGPKILLHNLFISALSGSELTFSYILVSPGRQLPTNYQWLQWHQTSSASNSDGDRISAAWRRQA